MNNFSPNMLKTFNDCPKKYYFKYIQQISAPQRSLPFEKGKKIHALANYYLRGDDISKLEKTLNQDENTTWQLLKSNEYFQKQYINSEYNLSCKVGDYWIGGRIDAIVKDESGIYILDYKTGRIPKNPEMDYQTMVYLLATDAYFKDTYKIYFVYIDLKNNTNIKIQLTNELKNKYLIELKKTCSTIAKTTEFKKIESNCKYCECQKFCYSLI